MKIVINTCYGGYQLSEEAYNYLGLEWDGWGYAFEDDRTNPDLIKCVETLGSKASGELAKLKIVEVPDDIKCTVENYDGMERVEEVHRIWC